MSEDNGTTTMTTPFKVDNWLVDPSDNQAQHIINGAIRPLEPRLMRLLCALASSPRRVIDRNTLIESVWPRVIVNENSLTRAISDLRKALHTDDVTGKKLIQTVPKRGYRLMAEVAVVTGQPDTESPASVDTSARTQAQAQPANVADTTSMTQVANWQRWLPAMAASLLVVIAAVMQLPGRMLETQQQTLSQESDFQQSIPAQDMIVGQPVMPARNALAEQTALTATNTFHWHGDVAEDFDSALVSEEAPANAAVLAPEGNLLAYVEHSNNASRLMLRPTYTDAKPWTAFTTDERIMQLQWSPLGDGVLFTLEGTATAGSNRPGHAYRRLMLLDIQSLALHELYRKEDSPAANRNSSGNLT
ncbi:transcriptional regulator [Pseudohongiella nitratireducens]|uniref:winged helix-turn-helix domain-containing protein n=1 Tax=Pseudohongiella nitratireducens TaxID=1768907 RepID=UPI0030ECCC1F